MVSEGLRADAPGVTGLGSFDASVALVEIGARAAVLAGERVGLVIGPAPLLHCLHVAIAREVRDRAAGGR